MRQRERYLFCSSQPCSLIALRAFFVPSTARWVSMPELRGMTAGVQFLRHSTEPCATPPTSPFTALLMCPSAVKADVRFPHCSSIGGSTLLAFLRSGPEFADPGLWRSLIFPFPTGPVVVSVPSSCRRVWGSQPGASDNGSGRVEPTTAHSWLLQSLLPMPWRIERPRTRECFRGGPACGSLVAGCRQGGHLGVPTARPGEVADQRACHQALHILMYGLPTAGCTVEMAQLSNSFWELLRVFAPSGGPHCAHRRYSLGCFFGSA